MPVREIVLLGDPILREKVPEVETFDEDLRSLVRDMFITMAAAEGAGLAAPQVGIRKRVLVADVGTKGEKLGRVALVNPIIVKVSAEEDRSSEGCLSVPGVTEVVSRPDGVILEGFDPIGNPVQIEAEGLLSRVLQHEMDHLEGVLFFDRISALKRRMLLKKYRKLRDEEAAG